MAFSLVNQPFEGTMLGNPRIVLSPSLRALEPSGPSAFCAGVPKGHSTTRTSAAPPGARTGARPGGNRWSLSPRNAEEPEIHDVGKLNSINRAQFDKLGYPTLPISSKPATIQGCCWVYQGFTLLQTTTAKKFNSKSDWWFQARSMSRWANHPQLVILLRKYC